MRFSITAVLTLAIGAMALPGAPPSPYPMPGNSVTVGQAGDACGTDFELSCCNKVSQRGDETIDSDGLLGGALSGLLAGSDVGLFEGCSKLDVAALIGVEDLLNSNCKQTAACCQHSGANQEGLVNVGLPCVALGGLL